jgi:hydroxyacylglutathione hydrolase
VIFDRRRYSKDNYTYLLVEDGDAALVDPGDPSVALGLAAEHGAMPRYVVHTHGHGDHTGGTAEVVRRTGATVYGHGTDAGWYPPDVDVAGRSDLALGALELRLYEVPGHTPGSVLYEWRGRLFSGDTLFWGGSGNCKHGGDPARLARSFFEVLARLDGALVVHPGHDYAEANLPFALDLDPSNAAARAALEAARAAHARGEEPAPTTLAQERRLNPFLRPDALVDALAARGVRARDATGAFLALRALRDRWSG